jgi:hypothetical protein
MRFASDNKVHGMLRAYRESRQIMLRLLPIRLPSKFWKKELRIGHLYLESFRVEALEKGAAVFGTFYPLEKWKL